MARLANQLAKALLSVSLWGCLILTTPVGAEAPQMMCGEDCHCGCREGKPCTCHPAQEKQEECECKEIDPADALNAVDTYAYTSHCFDDNGCCPKPWIGSDQVYEGPDSLYARLHGARGLWFPEDPPLFRPFMADPREICYSAGWRFNDQVFNKNVIDVSYGDSIALYRWFDVWPWCGDLQLDVQGALWALFDPLHESSPLIDADYYIGFPLTYAFGDWSFRLRGYHISTHIGDEFLLNHPGFDRKNPSAEFIDFFVSNQFTDDIRLYGGVGYIAHQDESFIRSRFFTQGGVEVRLSGLGFYSCRNHLYGEPIMGMNFGWTSDYGSNIDQTYVIGYELGKTIGLRRKTRIFLEYHDGFSAEGQFCLEKTNYLSLRISYGY